MLMQAKGKLMAPAGITTFLLQNRIARVHSYKTGLPVARLQNSSAGCMPIESTKQKGAHIAPSISESDIKVPG